MANANPAPRAGSQNKPAETKSQVFKRLAESRMNKVLSGLDGVAKLSNKSAYEYTPDQVAKITGALKAAVERVEGAFAGKAATKGGFTV